MLKKTGSSCTPRSNPKRPQSALDQLRDLLSVGNSPRAADVTEDHILSLLVARRGREGFFGEDLFSDPAWDILLELYAARLGRRDVSVSQLATAIDTPWTVAARWVAALSAHDLVVTKLDGPCSDQVWVRLSDNGEAKMKKLADQWGSAFLSI